MASSNYDVLAGMQDILGYQGLVGDNPYLAYQGAIPFGQNYQTLNPFSSAVQGPTDAYGNPIQPPQGTTLNSNPVQQAQAQPQQQAQSPSAQQQWQLNNAMMNAQFMNAMQNPNTGIDGSGRGAYTGSANNQALQQIMAARQANNQLYGMSSPSGLGAPYYGTSPAQTQSSQGGGGGGQPQSQQQASGGGPLTNQQYLSLLANPGPVKPVGAAPPGPGQAPTGPSNTGGNVMSAFLAANKSGNTPFLNTLRTIQDQAAGGVA